MNESINQSQHSVAGMVTHGESGLLIPQHATVNLLKSPSVPEEGQVFVSKIPLEPLWRRQVGRLIELGFHEELGIKTEDYMMRLPFFLHQPNGHTDIPAIIETEIPLSEQLKRVGFRNSIVDVLDIVDVPSAPYCTWFGTLFYYQEYPDGYGGSFIHPVLIEETQDSVREDEQPATFLELVSVLIHYPQILGRFPVKSHLLASGSRTNTGGIPGLSIYNSFRPYLPDIPFNKHDPGAILTRSRRINWGIKKI